MRLTLIVRHGALRRFDRLKRVVTELPVDVIWDRRVAPAEKAGHARTGEMLERRRQPSFTWEVADFVVMEKERER